MFLIFHLSISFVVDADLRSVWGLLPGFGSHGTVRDFHECFGKSLYGRNLLLMIQDLFLSFHGTSDSPPMKGYIHQPVSVPRICRRFSTFTYTVVCASGEMSTHFV